MTGTEAVFLELYRLALQGDHAEDLQERIRGHALHEVFRLAEIHCIFPMICQAVYGSDLQTEDRRAAAAVRKAERITLMQAKMTAEFLKLYRFLSARNLDPIVMKGIICRSLYPNPEQRPSTDEDLLIPEKQFEAYHQAFTSYGLQVASPDVDLKNDHEIPYCNSQIYLEVHKTPFPPESISYGDLNRFFRDVEDRKRKETVYGVDVWTMDDTDHLFYLLCHAYKHFLNCGIGIRQVSDIVLFSMAKEEKIDWKLIIEQCKEISALEFVRTLYRIGQLHLFPDFFPDSLREKWRTDEVEESALIADILSGGVYGTSSEERLHSANITLGTMAAQKGGSRSGAAAQTLFPPIESLTGRYPYLRKMPFLLPAAWAHRLFSYSADLLRQKGGNRKASEAVRIGNERVALMRQYGILEQQQKERNPLKRLYSWTKTSFLAPVLSPVFVFICQLEYGILNGIWFLSGDRMPNAAEKELVAKNVTFIFKSFERQALADGLCRNISRMYPGAEVIVADDSRLPLAVDLPAVTVIHLPFNSGLSTGLQAALDAVRTPFIVRLDDDELLTIRSRVHRELRYLMDHPELDLIGFGHTTAIRLRSPQYNFKEYYNCPMADAPRPLKIPHMTEIDENHIVLGKVANIYLARTEKVREVGFNQNIRILDHHDFFRRAAGIITSAIAKDTVVFHRHNPYARKYNAFRSDDAADLKYINSRSRRNNREVQNEK